jgi:hypothetical protein
VLPLDSGVTASSAPQMASTAQIFYSLEPRSDTDGSRDVVRCLPTPAAGAPRSIASMPDTPRRACLAFQDSRRRSGQEAFYVERLLMRLHRRRIRRPADVLLNGSLCTAALKGSVSWLMHMPDQWI